MTVSFYINRNDLQELNFLVENFSIVPFDEDTREKAVIIECFNSIDCIERAFYKEFTSGKNKIGTMDLYILVSVDYLKYNKIKEYLKFYNF